MSHVLSFAQNQRGELRTSEIAMQLTTGGGKPGEGYPAILTSSTGASPASHSPWPADARVLRTNVTDGLSSDGSCPNCGHNGSLQRMSPDFYPSIQDATSDESSVTWQNSGSLVSPTQFWTRNSSASRNAADACSLSRVLEDAPSSRYSLSAKAAAGILRRAERRGKELPEALRYALTRLAQTATT